MLRANEVVVTHVGRPCCIFSTTRDFSTLCDRSCNRPLNGIAACNLHSFFKPNWSRPLDDETVSMQHYRINGDFTPQGL